MKRILGLDLGTTSIGFAYVLEAEKENEQSSIRKIGVRVNPLTTDEQINFEKGKPLTTNANRTLKRGARRNLDRYQQRRDNLIEVLKEHHFIFEDTPLTELGKNSTFNTWRLRAKAVTEFIEKDELARVLLAINKKRGYKSSRKVKNEDDGQAVDGMAIAKMLYDENLSPGQLAFQSLKEGKKNIPEFYRSDLQAEFERIWEFQKQFHPEILTGEFHEELQGKGQRATSTLFWKIHGFNIAEIKDIEDDLKTEKTIKLNKRQQKKLQGYKWRNDAISKRMDKEKVAYVLTEINNDLNRSSGYLGAISDRSKELYFKKETVGQNLYGQLQNDPHACLKNKVFYRQDYFDEFEAIWETQAKFHPELTNKLKEEIRDIIIFYQRKLKSQKGLIGFCEFENRELKIGEKTKTVGLRVTPKSSPLFQEFKIWQILNNVIVRKKGSRKRSVKNNVQNKLAEKDREIYSLSLDEKELLFDELNLKGNLKAQSITKILGHKANEWEINYSQLEGNVTNKNLYEAYLKILELEGYDIKDLLKVKSSKDEADMDDLDVPAHEIKEMVRSIFEVLEINTEILDFNAELEGKEFEKQVSYLLWHMLYSTEDDNQKYKNEDVLVYGNDSIGLKKQLCQKFGFKPEHAKILVNVSLTDDYGSLSAKAMRNIYPYIKEHQYSDACEYAGYRHSKHSLTKEEIENRELKPSLDLLKKNSLRNPVVEKILNQMVNVVNTLLETERQKDPDFRFDEIRIELARELKKNAAERAEMTTNINAAKSRHEKITKRLQNEFGILNPTRNDIIRYKLYDELKNNGYKDLYSDSYIAPNILFTKEIDIDHIIPQSKAFDDSFSNKALAFRKDNLKKGNRTAFDFIESEFGHEKLEEYLIRINQLHKYWSKDKPEDGINKTKLLKLQKKDEDIGEGFAERDLRESQYIAKKAKNMLFQITRSVVSTSGAITNYLREDWDLINVMKELNLPKYRALGLTEIQERKFGKKVEVITDWTKRNDHRHHAMDAITVAFTKHNHIQYLNYLNARKDESHKLHSNIQGIEDKETVVLIDKNGNKRRKFKEPIPNFRNVAKEHLEQVLISHKTKNKVVTKNKNRTKFKNGINVKIELTPRGQLHKETVYGKIKLPMAKTIVLNKRFTIEQAKMIINQKQRSTVLTHLSRFENNPEIAFDSKTLKKHPIFFEGNPLKDVHCYDEVFTVRKDVDPTLKIDKVIDEKVKALLRQRLSEFNGNPKEAFSDLDKNPIWLNEEKGITVKRVTIKGVSNAEPLHFAKDHLGHGILDKTDKPIPVDYISTGNNHHVAIYKDEKGNLQEKVVSFFEAVERVNQGLPIIDKSHNAHLGWEFLFTMKQNEVFVFPNEENDFNPTEMDLMSPKNSKLISPNLFRVQTISVVQYGNSTIRDFKFRHHLETNVEDRKIMQGITYQQIKSLAPLNNIIKVRMNHLGDIVSVGEY